MLEVEVKFRVQDPDVYLKTVCERWNVVWDEPALEQDLFFSNDALGFPSQGKSLRIRRRDDYLAVTFKGPRLDELTKTREEIELPLIERGRGADEIQAARESWIRLLENLGFQRAAGVEKTRRRVRVAWQNRDVEITFDVVPGLGAFTELETVAPKDEFQSAKDSILRLADALNLSEPIQKSYLALALERDRGVAIEEK